MSKSLTNFKELLKKDTSGRNLGFETPNRQGTPNT